MNKPEAYVADPDHREKARRRAAEWYQRNKEYAKQRDHDKYERTKILKGGKAKGSRHHHWKGEQVRYWALHAWVRREKGQPTSCSMCGKNHSRIQWANVNHLYRRNVEDFIALCASCHYRFDIQNGLRAPSTGVKKTHKNQPT